MGTRSASHPHSHAAHPADGHSDADQPELALAIARQNRTSQADRVSALSVMPIEAAHRDAPAITRPIQLSAVATLVSIFSIRVS